MCNFWIFAFISLIGNQKQLVFFFKFSHIKTKIHQPVSTNKLTATDAYHLKNKRPYTPKSNPCIL